MRLPSSLESFHRNAFLNCDSLQTLVCEAAVPPRTDIDAFHYVGATLYVPQNSVNTYKYTIPWNFFAQVLPLEYAPAPPGAPVRGDVDGSGAVDVDDLNIVINIMVRKAAMEDWPAADLDASGVVDVDDLNHVINIMLHKE